MRSTSLPLLFFFAACHATGCVSEPEKTSSRPPVASPPSGWAPENRERIERFLREHGTASKACDASRPPCATFDWDMTSIFNDIGEATFYYQVRSLYLKVTPAELEALIPSRFQKTGASLAEAKRETVEAFTQLHAAGLTGPRAAPAKISNEKRDAADLFAYRMVWFYNQLETVDGPLVAYPWLVKLYKNLLPAELARLSELVLAHEVRAPGEACTTVELVHPSDKSAVPIKIRQGIVTSPEMKELMGLLRVNGFEVYIVTASFKGAVEPIAMRYGVRPDHVVGMRLTVKPDGSLGDEVLEPFTYRAGKVENIKKFVPSPPLFAAGDSDTDVEMLLQESVQLRLILDRKKSPASDIGKLCERARTSDREHWLIQGRDDYGADGNASGTWNGTTETRLGR